MGDDHKLQELLDLVDDLDAKLQDLCDAVNTMLDHLPWFVPDWVVDKIHDKWNELVADWDRELGAWRAELSAIGEAWTLRGAADQWSTEVAAQVSGLPGTVAAGPLQSDDIFSGSSANAYRGVIPGQGTAMTNISTFTSALSKGLDDIADAINSYCTAMIVAVIALGVAVASAVVAVATSETGVGAIAGIVACIGALAVFAGAILKAETDIDNSAESVQNSWNTALGNWTGYDGQKWPVAVFPS